MRLTCPNCGAQYEVDGSVIPEGGRDVQCSNCGHTWYQKKSGSETLAAPEQAVPDQAPDPAPAAQSETASAEAPAETVEADDIPGAEETDETARDEDQPPLPDRQPIPQDVADILQDEADLEASRRAPTPPAPEQPAPEVPVTPDAESGTIFAGAAQPAPDHTDPSDPSRRGLLPDIEEINSTLAATTEDSAASDDPVVVEMRRKSGFRRGFSMAMLFFAFLALIYVFAPNIADAVPQTASALSGYVDWINGLRASLDGMMLGAVDKLTALLAQLSGDQAG